MKNELIEFSDKRKMSESDIKLSRLVRKNRAYREKVEALISAQVNVLHPIKIPSKKPCERTLYFLRKNTKLAREVLREFEKLSVTAKSLCLKKKPRDLWLPSVINCPRKIQIRTYTASSTKKISMEAARDLLRKEKIEWGDVTRDVLKAYKDRIFIRYVTGLKYELRVENQFNKSTVPLTPWVICLINNQVPILEIKKHNKSYMSKVQKLKHVFFEDETRKAYVLPDPTRTYNSK